jgi:chromosome partitioning protein
MKSIGVFSVKGGVGKSTLAVNLAYAAATQSARRTLLWDLDAQGAATFSLKLAPRAGAASRKLFAKDAAFDNLIQSSAWPNLDLLAADQSLLQLERQLVSDDKAKRLQKLLRDLRGDYDRVVLDCPPGLNELAEQVFRAVDVLVVPMLPSPLSLRAFDQLTAHLSHGRGAAPLLVPVFNMVDRRRGLHKSVVDALPERAAIPYASAIEAMSVRQAPLAAWRAGDPAALAFSRLWADIERALGANQAAAT